ncbi:CGNR zinc finger domain-containing protein [Usitatibacter rugosus]|nr:CGNR zinc finger domain-containing protein [Usitatibacter rugosus]
MEPLFIGSHVAADFLNTTLTPRGEAIELIGDGASFVAWLVKAQLLDGEEAARLRRRFGVAALDGTAAEARKLRRWAGDWLGRWRESPRASYEAELRRLNELLGRASSFRELSVTKDGPRLVERMTIGEPGDLLGLVALEIAKLVAQEEPALLKRCAGAECTLWFLDRTKAHRRVFCSASACGNRAKVAAFRERQRG